MIKNLLSMFHILMFALVPFLFTQMIKAVCVVLFLIVSFIEYEFKVDKFYDLVSFNPTIFRITVLVSLGFAIYGICGEVTDRIKESERNMKNN